MKTSTARTEWLCFSRYPKQCMLQIRSIAAGGEIQAFFVVFTSDGRQNKGSDTQVSKANAVLRELYCSVVAKWELSNIAKLSV